MARILRSLAIGLGVVGVGAVGAFLVLGPERVWRIGGDPDQGSVDWDKIERSPTPNDALACSVAACATPADITLAGYDERPETLIAKVDTIIRGDEIDGKVSRVDDGQNPLARRYVLRTPTLGFPDTLNVGVRSINGKAGLMIYSRSLLGKSDLGANKRRVRDIVAALRTVAIEAH